MTSNPRVRIIFAVLLGALCSAPLMRAAAANGFAAFAEDEDVCRRLGASAIGTASGPSAAQNYDRAYRGCMAAHGQMRAYGAYGPPGPDGEAGAGNPHGFEFPDAFYSIPYATPGYGYDGFSN